MLFSPRKNQRVQIWYRKALAGFMPFHGRIGTVLASARGKPRNHVVLIGQKKVVVPCGNLRNPVDAG